MIKHNTLINIVCHLKRIIINSHHRNSFSDKTLLIHLSVVWLGANSNPECIIQQMFNNYKQCNNNLAYKVEERWISSTGMEIRQL